MRHRCNQSREEQKRSQRTDNELENKRGRNKPNPINTEKKLYKLRMIVIMILSWTISSKNFGCLLASDRKMLHKECVAALPAFSAVGESHRSYIVQIGLRCWFVITVASSFLLLLSFSSVLSGASVKRWATSSSRLWSLLGWNWNRLSYMQLCLIWWIHWKLCGVFLFVVLVFTGEMYILLLLTAHSEILKLEGEAWLHDLLKHNTVLLLVTTFELVWICL